MNTPDKHNEKISPLEACSILKAAAEEFLQDHSQHNAKGFRGLVNRRRLILSSIDIPQQVTGDPEVRALLEEISELEAKVMNLGAKLQSNLLVVLNNMRKSQTLFRRFRKKNTRKPLFIDKKS